MSGAPESPEGTPANASHRLAQRIREEGPVSFAVFMETALYDPEGGYYRQERRRIGTASGTDFYTAYSTGEVFATLVATAANGLLGDPPAEPHELVELGVEPDASLWSAAPPPFAGLRSLGRGAALDIPARAAVFSNELFDAQPFHRVRFRGGRWHEAGVDFDGERFVETLLAEPTPAVRARWPCLPGNAFENAALDLSLGAVALLERIAAKPWYGVFLAFDYGKRWEELVAEHTGGTLRAYRRHRQAPDILERPGEQDLTGHICWDWMFETLEAHGFRDLRLESQEAFFVHHARPAIEAIIAGRPGLPDPARRRLHELIHPGRMGQKFQVLSARRP